MATIDTRDYFGNLLPTTSFVQNVIQGTSGDDVLNGTSARDGFYGNGGSDTLIGGAGDDTYVVQYANTTIVEAIGGGTDTVKSTVNFVLPDNVENLFIIGTTGYSGTTGVGNAGANLIVGDANNQFIEGGAGNDVLIGGGGSDTFTFRPGSGYDAINDFQTGDTASGGDVIRTVGYGIYGFSDFRSHLSQQGVDTLLTLDATDKVLIRNTTVSSFTAANFDTSINTAGLKMTFDEEFNSPVSWYDPTTKTGTWLPEYGYGGIGSKASHDVIPYTGEQQIYVDPSYAGAGTVPLGLNPFNQHDGVMEIDSGAVPTQDASALWNIGYYSGMMSTVESFQQEYGYFEMRAELPSQDGAWPSFWLSPVVGTPPELDILEQHGSDPDVIHTSEHDVSLPNGKIGNTIYVDDATTAYHTYGLLWTPSELTWYIDGAEVYQQATPADMNQPMYLMINLPIGSVGGAVDPNNLPAGFDIDWIHAYALGVPGQSLTGGPSAGTLTGGDGADTLTGGAGADTLVGGAGDDTYYVDNLRDVVVEQAGGGNDLVYTSVSWTATAGSEIEKLVATGSNVVSLTGNATSMEIDANSGIDTLNDNGAADTLVGGLGNDTFIVQNAATVVVEAVNGGYDTVKTALPTYHLTDNVEVLTYTGSGAFYGIGNASANVITGGAGADTLDGGGGSDRLIGGKGDDTYYVDSSKDAVIENPGEGNDTVLVRAASYTAPANVEHMTYVGSGTFIGYGNATGVAITGGAGADTLYGGSGGDTLAGGGGNDVLYSGSGSNLLELNGPGAGVDRIINFHEGRDHVSLSSFGLTSLAGLSFVNGATASTATPTLAYDSSGKLYYEPAGGDPLHPILVATFDGHPTLALSDFILG